MKFDKEQDRDVLLSLIQNSTIQGAAVPMIASLIQRIEVAEIEEKDAQPKPVKTKAA